MRRNFVFEDRVRYQCIDQVFRNDKRVLCSTWRSFLPRYASLPQDADDLLEDIWQPSLAFNAVSMPVTMQFQQRQPKRDSMKTAETGNRSA